METIRKQTPIQLIKEALIQSIQLQDTNRNKISSNHKGHTNRIHRTNNSFRPRIKISKASIRIRTKISNRVTLGKVRISSRDRFKLVTSQQEITALETSNQDSMFRPVVTIRMSQMDSIKV